MVQIALFAGLGFLSALILVLLISPLLRRRTVRLTEKRLRAELPQSMEEIRADRDSVRADYAMRLRQMEIKLDKSKDAAVERALLMEARNEEVATLKTEVRQKLEIISELGDDLDVQRNISRDKEEELARAKSKLRDIAVRLERKIKELERAETRSDEMAVTIEKQRAELIETRASLRNVERYGIGVGAVPGDGAETVSERSGPIADNAFPDSGDDEDRVDPPMTLRPREDMMFEDRLDVDGQSAELKIQITELEAAKLAAEMKARAIEDKLASTEGHVNDLQGQLALLETSSGINLSAEDAGERQARIFDLEAQIGVLESDLAAKEARISALMTESDLARPDSADDETVLALRAKLLDVEAEKAAFEAEVTRLTLDLEMAGASSTLPAVGQGDERIRDMEVDLKAAQTDRDAALARAETLAREMKELEAAQEDQRKLEQAEISGLRQSLSGLAAEVTHIVRTLEGADSPVNEILAGANGHGGGAIGFSGGVAGEVVSLADRIKALRDRAASASAP